MINHDKPIANPSQRLMYALSVREMSQHDLAIRSKVSDASISQYCRGKFTPKQDRIVLFADILDVSEKWLMGFDVPMNRICVNNNTEHLLELYQNLDPGKQEIIIKLLEKMQ